MIDFEGILKLATLLVLAASFYLGYLNFKFLREQTRGGTLYNSVSDFSRRHRPDLEVVLSLENVPYKEWLPKHKEAAHAICFDLFLLGHIIKHKYAAIDFCELYYFSIPKVREICDPYIRELRQQRHPQYWRKFDDLVRITMEHTRSRYNKALYVECKVELLPELDEFEA